MPIHLAAADTDECPTAGAMVFVVDAEGAGTPLDLFGRGLHAVFGNYLTARSVGGGLAALCDDDTFLRAVRTLADTIYLAAGSAVDASPTNVDAPHVIGGVYPDATFVVVEPTPPELAAKVALIDRARVVRVEREELSSVLATFASSAPGGATAPVEASAALTAPVFVVGCPRSGTTWIQHLLAAHPGLDGPSAETAVFVAVRPLLENAALQAAVGRAVLVDAVRAFVATLAQRFLGPGRARFLEKTPIHATVLDLVVELFPDAWIVGVHRDGRDVVRSLLEVDAGSDDAATAAAFWVELTRAVATFAQRWPRARDERYEDWLGDPVVGAVDVLTWLGLPPDDAVVEELRRRAPQRVSQYNTTGSVGEGKWLDMPERDLRAVYRVAGDCLVEMGYASPSVIRRGFPPARFLRRARRR
jgi:hypothetical protein